MHNQTKHDPTSLTMKTFSLSSCDWIDFDLDHTTYQYNSQWLQISYDSEFGVKALIYDSFYGNFIQLQSNGVVHTALHGLHTCFKKKQN
jgi:hypothetical protein